MHRSLRCVLHAVTTDQDGSPYNSLYTSVCRTECLPSYLTLSFVLKEHADCSKAQSLEAPPCLSS